MVTVRLSDARDVPEIEDIKGIKSEAARLDLWDALSHGLSYHWIDYRPTINWEAVRLPQWIKRQDIKLVVRQ